MDDLVNRLRLLTSWTLKRRREKQSHLSEKLLLRIPTERLKNLWLVVSGEIRRMEQLITHRIQIQRHGMAGTLGKLDSLSPLSILRRGYSITRQVPSLEILRDASHVR